MICILSRSENTQKCSFLAGTIRGELGELLENLQKRNCKIMSKIAEFNSTTKKYKNSKFYCRTPVFSKGFVDINGISKSVNNTKFLILLLFFIVFQRGLAVLDFLNYLSGGSGSR